MLVGMEWETIKPPPHPDEHRRKGTRVALLVIVGLFFAIGLGFVFIVASWMGPIDSQSNEMPNTVHAFEDVGIPTTPQSFDAVSPPPSPKQAAALEVLRRSPYWLDDQEVNYTEYHGPDGQKTDALLRLLDERLAAADDLIDPEHPACLVSWRKLPNGENESDLNAVDWGIRLEAVKAARSAQAGNQNDAVARLRRSVEFLMATPEGAVMHEQFSRRYSLRIVFTGLLRAVEATPGDRAFHQRLAKEVLALAKPVDREAIARSCVAVTIQFSRQLRGEPGTQYKDQYIDNFKSTVNSYPEPLRSMQMRAGTNMLLKKLYAAYCDGVKEGKGGEFRMAYPQRMEQKADLNLTTYMFNYLLSYAAEQGPWYEERAMDGLAVARLAMNYIHLYDAGMKGPLLSGDEGVDPYSGGPLRRRFEEDRAVLWSVGHDGLDDDGEYSNSEGPSDLLLSVDRNGHAQFLGW